MYFPNDRLSEPPEKVCSFLTIKKHWFLYWGAHSQNQLYLIFYTFLLRKKYVPSILKNIYFCLHAFFHFFTLFSLRFILSQSDFGANKRAFKHCKPPIIVSLGSSTFTVPSLIRNIWRQNKTKERQDLHSCIFPNITISTPHFWRYFCIFSEFHVVNVFFSSPSL